MNEESTARADEASPAPESTTADANDGDVNGSMVKTKGGCCSSTKKFFLYDSSRPEIQAFYFNQVRMSIYAGRQTCQYSFRVLCRYPFIHTHKSEPQSMHR